MEKTMNFKQLQTEIHEHNKSVGWWDNVDQFTKITKLMLTVTEIAEATEGDRKNLMDDKVPTREMLEVELADVMIRTLDLGGYMNFCIDPHITNRMQRVVEGYQNNIPVPVMLFFIVCDVVDYARDQSESRYSQLLACIAATAVCLDLDLEGAMKDKREYNATRADHKRSNRVKSHGKTY
jgi:NTP pyrophosphatase (non-canonical NTP hydrolase)